MVLDKEELRQRVRIQDVWLGIARTAMLAAAVPEGKMRFVLMITLTGDTQQNRNVQIEKLEEDASYTMKWSNVPVAAAAMVHIMPNYDIEQPVIVLQGGSNLYGRVSGNSLQSIVHYIDDEINV